MSGIYYYTFNFLKVLLILSSVNLFVISAKDSSLRQKRQVQNCKINQWKCGNGQCIPKYSLCDGIYDCNDKSDETSTACYSVYCPIFAFRCTYGACIDGYAECNGITECVDNSDELSLNCPGVFNKYTLKGNCTENKQFQCDDGQCISVFRLCDGSYDCNDKSDETEKRCSSTFCPTFGYRCDYGACVSYTAKCDGNVDCVDGSDENYILCNYTIPNTIETLADGSCQILELPLNGKASYDGQLNTDLQLYDMVSEYSIIVYRCDSKYILQGKKKNICIGGIWSDSIPVCKTYCPWLPLSGISIKATCEYNGQTITCEQKLLPGTIARIACNYGYRKPNTDVNDLLYCEDDGQWDRSPLRCEQVCGIASSEIGVQYIVGGEKTNNTKVPWHVGIYSSLVKNNAFTQICGGTILNAKVIITAAHCFWNPAQEEFYDKKYFQVVAGKYYRNYYANEQLKTQMFAIDKFHSIQGYNDETDKFNNDIALLVLNKFIEFRSYIAPICVDWNLSFNERYVPADWTGRVAGWGLEQSGGQPSPELKVIELPTIDFNACRKLSTPEFRPFITGDKFCAGYTDSGVSVCQGDSGGGLVFPKINNDDVVQYYLRGIVSSGANKGGSCDNNKYASFTNIQYYISFIATGRED